ncbi:hypothetical protein GC163_09000 [bacterium]|nr:hypothetical protein [bacterium]
MRYDWLQSVRQFRPAPRPATRRLRPEMRSIAALVQTLEQRVLLSGSTATEEAAAFATPTSAENFADGAVILHTQLTPEEAGIVPASIMANTPELNGNGLQFNFIATPGMSQNAIDGFQAAADLWSSIFTDDIVVNININFTALAPGVLGQAGSTSQGVTVSNYVAALDDDARSFDDDVAVANLPTGSSLSLYTSLPATGAAFIDNDGTANNTVIDINTANAKAAGVRAANDPAVDASITFSSLFTWDFDRSNGITPGAFDFIGVAAHEIGHALGFVSGVDTVDVTSALGPSAPVDLNGFRVVQPLDLFRVSTASINAGTDIDLRADPSTKYFSIDGGNTLLTTFSTGSFNGDGRQASHWKDNLNIGVMDPTAAPGEYADITDFDVQAFDVIGWDVRMDFGDARDGGPGTLVGDYETFLASDGPRHGLFSASGLITDQSGAPKVFLGNGVTAETEGIASDGSIGDTDDGIFGLDVLELGQSVSFDVVSTGNGAVLDYFFDFNGDGDFTDAGESFSTVLTQIAQTITVDVPLSATVGETVARFRISTDGGLASTGAARDGEVEDYSIEIIDIRPNNPPTAIGFSNTVTSLPENTPILNFTRVADVVVTDDGVGRNNLSLSGADAIYFQLLGSQLFLRPGTVLDFETKSSYSVTVSADDPVVGNTPDVSAIFTLNVQDINEAPTSVTLQNAITSLPETTNTTSAITLGQIVVSDDALGTESITLVGPDAAAFEIVGGFLRLRAGVPINFETKSQYNVTIRVDDPTVGTSPDVQLNYTLTITDINEIPTGITVQQAVTSLREDANTNVPITLGQVVVTDDGLGTNTLSLTGSNANVFELVGNTLRLRAGTKLNFEAKTVYNVFINANDPTIGNDPDVSVLFQLFITDVNEVPTSMVIANPITSLLEGTVISTPLTVGTVVITDDALGTEALSLSGADAARFQLVGNELRLRAGLTLDFETQSSYHVTVDANDPTLPGAPDISVDYTLNVQDVNEAPTAVFLINQLTSVVENTPTAIKVADIVVIDDTLGQEVFHLTGADAASFEVQGTSLLLKKGTVLDFETKTSFRVTVNVDDPTVGTSSDASVMFQLAVTDKNEAPVVPLQQSFSVATRSRAGTIVGTISASDPDAGQTLRYGIVGTSGSDASKAFGIDTTSGTLFIRNGLPVRREAIYHLTVRVYDSGSPSLFTDTQVTVNVVSSLTQPVIAVAAPTTTAKTTTSSTTTAIGSVTAPVTTTPASATTTAKKDETLPVVETVSDSILATKAAAAKVVKTVVSAAKK